MKLVNKPIEMIAEFKLDSIKPIRFRITDENGEQQVYNIEGYRLKETINRMNATIYNFECNIIINNQKRLCEVWYNRDTCRWTLYKI
jgi:hypothetical protein